MLEPRAESPMRILIVDPKYERSRKEKEPDGPFSFSFSKDLSCTEGFDLVVLPAELFLCQPEGLPLGVPILAFGPIAFLADALAAGCSDYLREPLFPEELEARALRIWRASFALGRESYRYSQGVLEGAIDSLLLSDGERKTLELLLHRLGQAVPRQAFLRTLTPKAPETSRLVDMMISRLRKRLVLASGDEQAGAFLVAVRNYGYRLVGKPCA
jgi:hypothetical protein